MQAEDGENFVLSFIIWPDKNVRDAGWEGIMADPEMQTDAQPMPYDGKRIIWGGFNAFVERLDLGSLPFMNINES